MLIKQFVKAQASQPRFFLRNRRGDIVDRASAEVNVKGSLVVTSELDGSTYTSFSAWRGTRTNHSNTYDMISTEDGVSLRTLIDAHRDAASPKSLLVDEPTPEGEPHQDVTSLFRFRLYHGHTPLDYIAYMERALRLDLQRHAELVGEWPKIANRALSEAVKSHIRFQHGLRWADKAMPCLYREVDCLAAVDRGDDTAMDHVIPVSEMACAVLEEDRGFEYRMATLVRAWLSPIAHITKASHDHLTRGSHPDHNHPFHRYAAAGVSAQDHRGQDVSALTLDEHFEKVANIEWAHPIVARFITPYQWSGLEIARLPDAG